MWHQLRSFSNIDFPIKEINRGAFSSVIYNIAQVDFPENWKNSIQEVGDRIKQSI